jgi:hypothetical protein
MTKTRIALIAAFGILLTSCANGENPLPKSSEKSVSQYDQIETKAVEEISSLSNSGTEVPQNFKIYADPKIDKTLVDTQMAAINSETKLLSDFKPKKVTLLFWLNSTSAQIDWAQNIYEKIKGNYNKDSKLIDGTGSGCSNAGASDFKSGASHNYFISVCAGFNATADFRIMHEYYHLYQYSHNVPGSAPSWVTEGSADFIGQVLGLRLKDEALFRKHRREIADVSNGTKLTMTYSDMTEQDFVSLMKTQESAQANARISYYVGSLATEYLIGKYGYKTWDNFIKTYSLSDLQNAGDSFQKKVFSEKFLEVFGLEPSAFYVELYPYFKEMTAKYSRI